MLYAGGVMLKTLVQKLCLSHHLSQHEMDAAYNYMLAEKNEAQTAAFLALLHAKGETVDELVGLVKAMQRTMLSVKTPHRILDIVGTGGDGYCTVNISTASGLLAASCGVRIAKHGNRSVSSLSGSADVMDSLGCQIHLTAEQVAADIDKHYFGFMYAPAFHTALAEIKLIRKNLALPTIFNLIGPLLNPAHAQYIMLGVAKRKHLQLMADVLTHLGIKRGLVFHGSGLDEISTLGPVTMIEINAVEQKHYHFDPQIYGFKCCNIADLQGGNAKMNAALIRQALAGEHNPLADTLILNAAIALYIYGLAESIEEGVMLAKSAHRNQFAIDLLDQLAEHRYA